VWGIAGYVGDSPALDLEVEVNVEPAHAVVVLVADAMAGRS